MEDLVIKNGLVVTPCSIVKGGLTAKDGKITQVGNDASLTRARLEVDAAGNYILPGLIDPHVHLGRGSEEFWATTARADSASAAISGVTTAIVYYRSEDVQEPLLSLLKRAREIGKQNFFIDFKLSPLLFTESHLDDIPGCVADGFSCLKFLRTFRLERSEGLPPMVIDWALIYRGLEIIGSCGQPAIAQIHCEQPDITEVLEKKLREQGRSDVSAWTEARPVICEVMDTFAAGLISLQTGCPVYIVHISSIEAMDAIRYLRALGAKIYAETCPHYLEMNLEMTKDMEADYIAKVCPPLRDETQNHRMWQAVADGTIDAIGSDHCAYQLVDKPALWESKTGLPGVGVTLPIMMSEGVNRGRITIEQLTKVCSENIARIYGIYPQKGALSPGSDADIVIVDPRKEWVLGIDTLKGHSDFSPWEGKRVKGKAVKTFVRGALVAEDGELATDTPFGDYVYAY